jgi:SAM-dependent methyltransferase
MNALIRKGYNFLLRPLLKRSCESGSSSEINERIIEYRFFFNILKDLFSKPKNILDVGTGTSPFPAVLQQCGFEVSAIDNMKDYWNGDILNTHYYVIRDDITGTKLKEKYDMITCISTLEHVKDYMSAIKNMWKLLRPNGDLILTFPYNREEYVSNVYDLEECSIHPKEYICQLFSNKDIHEMIKDRFGIFKEERWKCFSGSYWRCGERYSNPKLETFVEDPDLLCSWWKKINNEKN